MGIMEILAGVAATTLTALSGQAFRWLGRKIDTMKLTNRGILDHEIRAALHDGVEVVGKQTVDKARELFIDGELDQKDWADIKSGATERAREYALTVLDTRATKILTGLSELAVDGMIRALVDEREAVKRYEEAEIAEMVEERAATVAARKSK